MCVCVCVCVVLNCRVAILHGQLPQSSVTAILPHKFAQLVDALRYKPEGRGFDSFRLHYVTAVESASNGIEYQEYFLVGKGGRCVELTTLPSSRADCLEIWDPQPPGTLRVCPGLYSDCLCWL